ncbi:sugar phosphate isomerase/epimerase [Maribacter caenipelagi]|uniref:Sugar phosphate isomerase/epimerase n=1 Tax=Maribacter caenipelagi TaxID=1447781 RepID=A0A4R7CV52_9FLAO|nr:TIM barrel protein [Maribacter caenipelagi]TDS12040.1 sugar phosphate isomerase/epimerase [Maribacter caenipelagi]
MKKSTLNNLLKCTVLAVFMLGTLTTYAQKKFGGLALYTVRDDMGTDAKATLKAVSDAGYKNIEAAGYEDGKYYGMTPADFKGLLKSLKLKPISTHQSAVTLDNADKMMADAKAAGFKYFVVPIPPMGMFTFNQENMTMGMTGTVEDLAKILTTLGEKANKAGLKLLYHNHDFEFKKNSAGIVPIDYLLENVDPKLLNFQMDLYWVTKAGANPIAYFNKYPGRFKIWHVKDMDEQGRFAPVGKGSIGFNNILANKALSGMKYYMVEQDMTFDGLKPLDAIKISHDGLEEIGFK